MHNIFLFLISKRRIILFYFLSIKAQNLLTKDQGQENHFLQRCRTERTWNYCVIEISLMTYIYIYIDIGCCNIILPWISGILKELSFVGEDNQSDLSITEHRDLVGFLQQPTSPFWECYLPVDLVLDPLHLYLTPSHLISFYFPLIIYYIAAYTGQLVLPSSQTRKKGNKNTQI